MSSVLFHSGAPQSDNVFVPTRDAYGTRLSLVFGNHAAGGICPFVAASKCHHCDIGEGEGSAFDIETNRRRLNWFQSHYRDVWPSVAHLVIYNSGSVLNPKEMPVPFLNDILDFARRLDAVRVVSLDSRECYVTTERLLHLVEQLRSDQCVRIIIGVESANDHVRNTILEKQMPRESILRAIRAIGEAGTRAGPNRLAVDINILVGGPGVSAESAPTDAAETARFALDNCEYPVDFNLHPYYPSRRGLARFPTHPRCSFAALAQATRAVIAECGTEFPNSRIFIGVNDEGHDIERAATTPQTELDNSKIARFNATQQVDALG